jgi:hypothetical protein
LYQPQVRRCEPVHGYKAPSMNLIKTMQRATMMAKPNKVVNNSVPFPIAYSFILPNPRSSPLRIHVYYTDLAKGIRIIVRSLRMLLLRPWTVSGIREA